MCSASVVQFIVCQVTLSDCSFGSVCLSTCLSYSPFVCSCSLSAEIGQELADITCSCINEGDWLRVESPTDQQQLSPNHPSPSQNFLRAIDQAPIMMHPIPRGRCSSFLNHWLMHRLQGPSTAAGASVARWLEDFCFSWVLVVFRSRMYFDAIQSNFRCVQQVPVTVGRRSNDRVSRQIRGWSLSFSEAFLSGWLQRN